MEITTYVETSSSLFLSSFLLSFCLKFISSQRKQRHEEIEFLNQYEKELGKNRVEIELLPMEESNYTMLAAIPTITFYQGDVSSNIILQRLKEILSVNSWLAGRLIKLVGKPLQLVYSKEFSENKLERHYHELNILNYKLPKHAQVSEHSQLQTLMNHVEAYFVKRGYQCINKDEVLFSIIIVKVYDEENKPPTKTAFIMTLSHVIADGKNFYTIYSFFHPERTIYALNPVRDLSFPSKMQKMIGKEYSLYPCSVVLVIRALSALFFEFYPKSQRYKIDPHILHHRKQDYFQRHQQVVLKKEFISSNDYLTWWFFQELNSSYGFMAANCRNRVIHLTDEMAGNYTTLLLYSRKDYEESGPFEIRHSLKSLKSSSGSIPSTWETIDFRFGVVTNWASFYTNVVFDEECPLIYHSPLIGNKEIGFQDFMVIFRCNEKQLGLMIFSRTKNESTQWINSVGNEFLEPF